MTTKTTKKKARLSKKGKKRQVCAGCSKPGHNVRTCGTSRGRRA